MAAQTTIIKETLSPVYATLHEPLAELRQHIIDAKLREYEPTGETPQKQLYTYPANLPRTAPREQLLDKMRAPLQPISASTTPLVSPAKVPVIFHDATPSSLNTSTSTNTVPLKGDEDEVNPISSSESTLEMPMPTSLSPNHHLPSVGSLASVHSGLHGTATSQGSGVESAAKMDLDTKDVNAKPNLKRNASTSGLKQPSRIKRQTVVMEGKENVLPGVETFTKSGGGGRSRRSPRGA